jgi:hypothetical protein
LAAFVIILQGSKILPDIIQGDSFNAPGVDGFCDIDCMKKSFCTGFKISCGRQEDAQVGTCQCFTECKIKGVAEAVDSLIVCEGFVYISFAQEITDAMHLMDFFRIVFGMGIYPEDQAVNIIGL